MRARERGREKDSHRSRGKQHGSRAHQRRCVPVSRKSARAQQPSEDHRPTPRPGWHCARPPPPRARSSWTWRRRRAWPRRRPARTSSPGLLCTHAPTIRPRTHESLRWSACRAGRAACDWSRCEARPDEGRLLLEEALGDQHIAHCLCEIARAPACVYGPHCQSLVLSAGACRALGKKETTNAPLVVLSSL